MAIKISSRARRFFKAALGIGALSIGLIAVPGTANASAITEPPAIVGKSCSLDLATGSLVCVPAGGDLNQAVYEQQHLRVVVPSGARGSSASSLMVPASTQTTYVQSQLYDDINYGGSFLQLTNSNQCDGSTIYYLSDLGSYGWSGRVSSFMSFSNCTTKVWQGNFFTGAAYGYDINAASLGAMNDQANSVTLR